jgi:hypothetical protein
MGLLAAIAFVTLAVAMARANEPVHREHEGAGAAASESAGEAEPHPTVPKDTHWVRPVVWTIAGLFIAAIPVGILVRMNMPEEAPAGHAHDEEAADEHHGHGHGGGHH